MFKKIYLQIMENLTNLGTVRRCNADLGLHSEFVQSNLH